MRPIIAIVTVGIILLLLPSIFVYMGIGGNSIDINGDDYSKSLILSAINNTDSNITKYISSINVIPRDRIRQICTDSKDPVGCADIRYSGKDKIIKAYIYVANISEYDGLCNTFNNTIYHEIGHVVHAYYYGYNGGNNPEDFANDYANQFSKEKCDKNG